MAELKSREEAARAQGRLGRGQTLGGLLVLQRCDADPYVAGRNGAPGYIMAALRIENIIDTEDEMADGRLETIAKAEPTMIVAGSMERRRYPLDSLDAKPRIPEDRSRGEPHAGSRQRLCVRHGMRSR